MFGALVHSPVSPRATQYSAPQRVEKPQEDGVIVRTTRATQQISMEEPDHNHLGTEYQDMESVSLRQCDSVSLQRCDPASLQHGEPLSVQQCEKNGNSNDVAKGTLCSMRVRRHCAWFNLIMGLGRISFYAAMLAACIYLLLPAVSQQKLAAIVCFSTAIPMWVLTILGEFVDLLFPLIYRNGTLFTAINNQLINSALLLLAAFLVVCSGVCTVVGLAVSQRSFWVIAMVVLIGVMMSVIRFKRTLLLEMDMSSSLSGSEHLMNNSYRCSMIGETLVCQKYVGKDFQQSPMSTVKIFSATGLTFLLVQWGFLIAGTILVFIPI